MTIEVNTALQLAAISYNESGTPIDTPPGWGAIIPSTQVSSGFTGNAFYNSGTNTVVIGFGGTNGTMDLWADAQLAVSGNATQAAEAVSFASGVLGLSGVDPNANVVFVGHSLGGFLAQRAALEFQNSDALVFNSPGLGGFWGTSGLTADNVTYYYSNPDSWDGPSGPGLFGGLVTAGNVHNLGDLLNDNVHFILNASGHPLETMLSALVANGEIPVSATQWGAIIAEQLRTGVLQPHELVGFIGGQEIFRDVVLQAMRESGTECFGAEVPIDMWPLDPDLKPGPDGIYDQDEVRAKVWKKPIELIEVGDIVVSFDDNDNLVPGPVTRTFQNDAKILLDFHGTRVTPGHVYYRPDSKKSYKYETLIDVLRDDGMIKHQDGTLIRAATNVAVDSARDGFVQAIARKRNSDGTFEQSDKGRIRLGTRFLVGTGKERKSFAVADLIEHGGGVVGDDELIRVGDGEPMPFLWDFGETLPKPEDFVLACSGTTLEDIYKAAEWESQGPRLAAPMVLDRGPVQPLKGAALSAMPRNEPLDVTHSPVASAKPQRTLNRKQRKAMEAKQRKAAKSRKRIAV